MPFSVRAFIDDHLITVFAETAKEAFAKAVEWQVVNKLTDVSINDGVKDYSVADFSSVIAGLDESDPT